MKLYLGVTDLGWYRFLAKRENEDINFWQPGGNANFRVISPGAPFLFKLKSPINAIAGVGFFSSHAILPINVAWSIFQERNGVASLKAFLQKILDYRSASNPVHANPNVGCIILTDPIFFQQEDWIPAPADWNRSIVQGKSYTTDTVIGARLWENVEAILHKYSFFAREESSKSQLILSSTDKNYSRKYLTKVRLGQNAFRVQLTDAYKRRCSVSGERTLPALEAAHIKPYAESGPYYLSNGIMLRADIHKLYDAGYLTFTKDYRIEISSRIKEEFENGRAYYNYHGSPPVNSASK
jgi:putative restriction endonuclease